MNRWCCQLKTWNLLLLIYLPRFPPAAPTAGITFHSKWEFIELRKNSSKFSFFFVSCRPTKSSFLSLTKSVTHCNLPVLFKPLILQKAPILLTHNYYWDHQTPRFNLGAISPVKIPYLTQRIGNTWVLPIFQRGVLFTNRWNSKSVGRLTSGLFSSNLL